VSTINCDEEPAINTDGVNTKSAMGTGNVERTLGWIGDDIDKKIQMRTSAGMSSHFPACLERGTLAVLVYRFGRYSRTVRVPGFRQMLTAIYYGLFYFIQMFTGISIQAYTRIGPRFVVNNFSGIFVLAETIGADFTVCEGVTVGNIRGKGRLAIIGNNVYLEPGCKVLGSITIGDNVVVRANSLVLSDVPSNSMVMGNPARITPLQGI
jgi:serine acetyltransferase